MGTIVVGVDGSAGARAAAAFALREARLRQARLRLVAALHLPVAVFPGGFTPAVQGQDELEALARAALDECVVALGDTEVEIETKIRAGRPAEVLIQESADDAELLVVGSRGLGGFRGLLLGSVGQQCAHHAHCPVVVVRHASTRGGSIRTGRSRPS